MKKNLEKIFASASIVMAVILIMVLIVTAFGGIEFKEFENGLVRGLLITLAILYLVLAIVALTLMFVNSDVIKDIVIRTETGGSVRVSSKVITKLVKKACAEIEGLRCKKVTIIQDDYGVRLKINVKIVDKDVVETETYLRTLLTDTFFGTFGFKFESIEIKVMVLTPKYKSDRKAIEAIVAEKVREIRSEQEVNAPEVPVEEEVGAEESESPVTQEVRVEESAPVEEPTVVTPVYEAPLEPEVPAAEENRESSDNHYGNID